MLDPSRIRNKSGAGGGVPVAHPVAAICPRCGRPDAVALAPGEGMPRLYRVSCPGCGGFAWDSEACRVVEETESPHDA